MLNWYCTTESSWEPWCNKNSVGEVEVVPGSGLVPAKAFMSGSAFALSESGARKLINSFPCLEMKETTHYGMFPLPKDQPNLVPSCSSAIDWHISNLIEFGVIQAYQLLTAESISGKLCNCCYVLSDIHLTFSVCIMPTCRWRFLGVGME